MADNSTLPATGDIIAADDVGGVKYQRVKIVWGVDGTATETSASNPFPVTVSNASVAVTGTFFQATQPVSIAGTVTIAGAVTNAGTFAVQATDNITQLGGTAIDTNSGVKSAGTLRVVLATDQPALTNKLLVTPDSVALPANQSVNVSQINAVTPLMGNGVTGTGSQRVTIASDNTAFSVNAAQSGTYTVGLSAAQTLATVTTVSTVTNLSQLGGVAIAMNTGVRSTGTQRVTIATDDVVPASQSGTWTVQPGNTANTTAWLVKEIRSATGTQSNVASSATDVTILASNANRLGASVYNDSTAILYLLLSNATSSATVHTAQLAGGAYYEVPANYTGVLKGLWASATGSARVTEYT